eukprot:ANDGO_07045.mRNA.1 hypothetical protein
MQYPQDPQQMAFSVPGSYPFYATPHDVHSQLLAQQSAHRPPSGYLAPNACFSHGYGGAVVNEQELPDIPSLVAIHSQILCKRIQSYARSILSKLPQRKMSAASASASPPSSSSSPSPLSAAGKNGSNAKTGADDPQQLSADSKVSTFDSRSDVLTPIYENETDGESEKERAFAEHIFSLGDLKKCDRRQLAFLDEYNFAQLACIVDARKREAEASGDMRVLYRCSSVYEYLNEDKTPPFVGSILMISTMACEHLRWSRDSDLLEHMSEINPLCLIHVDDVVELQITCLRFFVSLSADNVEDGIPREVPQSFRFRVVRGDGTFGSVDARWKFWFSCSGIPTLAEITMNSIQ